MTAPQLLRYLHLPSITPFTHAQTIQQTLVSQFLSYKALSSHPSSTNSSPSSNVPPTPTLLSFTPTPVYTTGRRELNTLTASQIAHLTAPLPSLPPGHPPSHASVVPTLRGGLITFHGPGQLVLYPILDLKTIASPLHPRGLTARCYVHLLEETTIRTLKRYGVEGRRTENPGVWVDEDVKIAAVGVHARRNVVSYGVGLNVGTDLRWFERVVACGLVGKETTSIEAWRKREGRGEGRGEGKGEGVVDLGDVASVWGREFARGLWGEQQERVRDVNGEERRGLLEGLLEEGSDVYGEDIRWKDPEDVE